MFAGMGLQQPHVMLAYAMPASDTTNDASGAALLAASKPLLQWLTSILDAHRQHSQHADSCRIPTLHERLTANSNSCESAVPNVVRLREELRSTAQRATGSSLLGLYQLAVAHEQELDIQRGHNYRDRQGGSCAPVSESEGLAAIRALVNHLHQQDANQQPQQQPGQPAAPEASAMASLYAYAALDASHAATPSAGQGVSDQNQSSCSAADQQQQGLARSSSLHRVLAQLSALSEEATRTQPLQPHPAHSSHKQHGSAHDMQAYSLISNLPKPELASSSSPFAAAAVQAAGKASGSHQQRVSFADAFRQQ